MSIIHHPPLHHPILKYTCLFQLLTFLITVTQIVAKDNVDSNNANNNAIVFQEKVTWFNLDKPIEAILTIYKNENAAEVTREFYNRYAINEDALFSLLDRVCIGDSLCQPHDIIFDETININHEKEKTESIEIKIVVKVKDNPHHVIRNLVKEYPFLKEIEERLLKRICTRLKRLCIKYDDGKNNDENSIAHSVNILRSNYNHNEKKYKVTMERLDNEARKVSGYIEGNLWSDASQGDETKSKNKRECEIFAISMINLFKAPKSFLEIGFNAGHSLSLFLHNIPSIETVFEFDICQHAYVQKNFNIVKSIFPHVNMKLMCGDSKQTIVNAAPILVDIIHIDGGHDYNVSIL